MLPTARNDLNAPMPGKSKGRFTFVGRLGVGLGAFRLPAALIRQLRREAADFLSTLTAQVPAWPEGFS
jgi:hypothetical protein